jgi:hypothetical protein
VFDEFIAKGGEYEHKVGRTITNRVDERTNMINDYLREKLALRVFERVDFRGSIHFELLLCF